MRFLLYLGLVVLAGAFCFACGDDDNPVKSKKPPPPDPNEMALIRNPWHVPSRPVTLDPTAVRGKTLYHTMDTAFKIWDVYATWDAGADFWVTPFRIILRPVDAPSPVDSFLIAHGITPPTRTPVNAPSWGGIMMPQAFEIGEFNPYFNVRMKATQTIVHFEFGRFTMDLDGDGVLQAESWPGDFGDSGFDWLMDHEEPGYDPATNVDPNDDNWYFRGLGKCPVPEALCEALWQQVPFDSSGRFDYEWLNGTEGNDEDFFTHAIYDDELLPQSVPNFVDEYFSFKVDLITNPDEFAVPSEDKYGWRTYRFPLRSSFAPDTVIGTPSWDDIQCVRVWLEAPAGKITEDTVLIARWGFNFI